MNNPAVWLVIAAVYAGLLLSTVFVASIAYDLVALRRGWRTISEQIQLYGQAAPWVPVMLAGWLCFALGVLIGHLFFPLILN